MVAPQQPQEERAPRHGGDGAHGKLATPQHGARHGVAYDEKGGTAKRRGGDEQAMIGPQQETQHVWDDEAHEADQSGHGHRGPYHERGRDQQHALLSIDIDAELLGRLLAQGEQVETARQGQGLSSGRPRA